jgi:predicted TIM-barrel fold metal-dependent hydrolase
VIDVSRLAALDVHVHVMGSGAGGEQVTEAARRRFGGGDGYPTIDEIAERYRALNMAAVVFTVDSEAGTGRVRLANEHVIEGASRNSDVLIPFASIDPWKGRRGVEEARALIADGRVRGFKFHPLTQAFFANDRIAYPLYELIEEARLVALFHTGQGAIGAGLPGGGGIRLKYGNPIYLDDVAADFPHLTIIQAHPSVPWQPEAIAIALHKANVYIDLSGWSPRYFPPELVHYSNTLLREKVLFGSDFPFLTPERWLADFEQAGFRDEVRRGILCDNAARVLAL